MKQLLVTATMGMMMCLCAAPVAADEEYDCTKGGQQLSVSSVMYLMQPGPGPNNQNIVYVWASTTRSQTDVDHCTGWLRVEGWIDGGDLGAIVKQGTQRIAQIGGQHNVVELSKLFTHVCGETHKGTTKHFWIKDGLFSDPWTRIEDEDRRPETTVPTCEDPPPPPPPDGGGDGGGGEDSGGPGCSASPLLFDRNGDGFNLTSPSEGVMFDIDADGVLDQVAWTRADSDDAWLALDRNGNGRIDDGSELFGNRTPVYPSVTAKNGFEALKFIESPEYGPSKTDLSIDAKDTGFARLLVWSDANHNGISEPDELQTANAAGLLSISTVYEERKRRDEHGNEFKQKGRSYWLNEQGKVRQEVVWDVWLQLAR